ncbi:MAG: fibronectin type III domain-containing protein, partial [Muribaculaceae bacterium]|nr:fibronectin type III domain-containing protein [Muribaculaceae bacterium]
KPDNPTDFKMTFDLNGGNPIAKGSFVCPTMNYPSYDGPIGKITKVRVIRGCSDVGVNETDLVVYESTEEREPGSLVEFTDQEEGWVYGHQYTYNVKVWDEKDEEGWGTNFYLFAGVKPASPEVSVAVGENGLPPVTITVTAPTTTAEKEDLTVPLTQLRVIEYIGYENEREIKIINDPVPGGSYEVVDNETEEGKEYSYRVYASCEFGTSEYGWASAFVGQDVPGKPGDIALTENEDGSVTLTWTAPEKGKNGGYFDPAATRYKVIRNGDAPKDLAEDLTECTYTDALEGLTGPTAVKYEVVAYNAMGDGDYALSPELLKGPAYSLPFEENFNAEEEGYWGIEHVANKKWTYEFNGYSSNWDVTDYAWSLGINGVGDGDGVSNSDDDSYVHTYYASRGDVDTMVSSAIDFKEATFPVLSFYHAAKAGDPTTLTVGVRNGGESEDLVTIIPGESQDPDAEDPAWIKYSLPLESVAGHEAAVFFTAAVPSDAEENNDIALDRIIIADYPGIDKVSVAETADGLEVSWIAPKNSYDEEPESYDVVVDDAEPVNVTDTKHVIMATRADGDESHKVSVRANYGDIQGKFSPSFDAVPGGSLSGISTIGGNGNAKVEYFDVNGLPVVKAMKGSTIIRRTVNEN